VNEVFKVLKAEVEAIEALPLDDAGMIILP
jgi:hypothetical protein